MSCSALATSADEARELRTYGITDALAERHGALAERVRPAQSEPRS